MFFIFFFLPMFPQLKSLEATLAGAIRREQMAGTSIKRLEAEIEFLNRLVTLPLFLIYGTTGVAGNK